MNEISIWDDKILLHWDQVLPEGARRDAIHSVEDVIPFWPALKDHVKFSRRLGTFTLTLSKQNLKRIHAQFGQIPIRNGGDRVAEIKKKQQDLFNLAQTIKKVKELDTLPQYEYKMKPLAQYQHRGVVFLSNARKAPLFADCGMGKTYMVLNSIQNHKNKGVVPEGKTLIAVKLATIETGWLEDAEKFTDLKLVSLWVPTGKKNRKQIILDRLNEPADAYVINHEGIRLFENELAEKKFMKVIIDESTILKNFRGENARTGTAFGKAMMNVARHAEWRVVMSGTPAPNGPEDLWGQFIFLDPEGLVLEPNFNDFQRAHFKLLDLRPKAKRFKALRPKDPQKWVPTKQTIQKVAELTNPFVYRVRMKDHLHDMPELTIVRRKIAMSTEQSRHYEDMKNNLRVVINDSRITAQVKITQLMKLRQITGGFIIDHQEEAHAISDNPKIDMLDSLLDDEIDHEDKVVIYCQYQWEIKTLESRYKRYGVVTVYGGNSSTKNLANIKKFREDPKTRIVILHPKSAAHGITFTMAHYMVFYSIDHSAEDNYQCIKRIERAGQKNAMLVYYLLVKDSIDEMIYRVIQDKNKNQASLIDEDQALLSAFSEDAHELQLEGKS
jgi:SNF2 family DNA or RNA helicase